MTLDDRVRAAIEKALGYTFKDSSLAEQALTHRSLVDYKRAAVSNQPLEFLGDAVLSFIIADLLHERDPAGPEGVKSRIRARLVSTPTLVSVARDIDVRSAIRMSPADEKNNVRSNERVQEDAVEALIAAVYLDGGIEAARAVVIRHFLHRFDEAARAGRDAKGALQEFVQAQKRPNDPGVDWDQLGPRYESESTGSPAHREWHRATCSVAGEVLGHGEATTRKKAELAAAEQALEVLKARAAKG